MPSGVSHGAAAPAGAGAAVGSNATALKSGMRLMASCPQLSIMVRVLMARNGRHLLRPVILLRGLARQVGDRHHPAETGFRAELPRRHDAVGPIERPCHDLDPRAVDAAEAERRAASCTEVTVGDRGRTER